MKPKPTDSMHSATAPGSRSIRAPSASSTSAAPERLVAERLPCLATRHPAPAATNAAVVETLKVGRPPPVPAVSSNSPGAVSTPAAKRRIVRASPASSSSVSPFVRRAMRKPAICASATSPAMISASTAAACSSVRSRREATVSIARVRTSLGMEEVPQHGLAVRREDRFGVELHALGGQVAVAHAHEDAAAVRRGHELAGQVVGVDDERVVAADGDLRRQSRVDVRPVVLDLRRLAVDRLALHDAAAEGLRHRLM